MADAVHFQILEEVRDALEALALEGIGPEVFLKWAIDPSWAAIVKLPCAVVTPNGMTQYGGGPNALDDFSYPVTVLFVDRIPDEDTRHLVRLTGWRQTTIRAFHNKRLSAVTENYGCQLQPSPVVEVKMLEYQLLVSPLTFHFRTRESRT